MSNLRNSPVIFLTAFLMGACAAPASIPATTQPALSAVVQPYAGGLRKAGINSVQVFGNSARVRIATNFGEIYLRYPASLTPTAFVVYVDAATADVDSDTYNAGNSTQYEAAIRAILPAAIESANENNVRVINNRFGKN
jgi:hypothetical protein